jgi:D-glycero-D-manno-heptose 1,7-bisphosphate phosphatase
MVATAPVFRPALFLDRDGVVNVDKNYLYRIADFEWMDGVQGLMRHAQQLGYAVVVVTNQSGIGRGYYSEQDFQTLSVWMRQTLAAQGIQVAAVYHCPHAPDQDCVCRKPRAGMLLQAAAELGLDLAKSVMIGDKESDVEAGLAAGLHRLVRFAPVGTASAAPLVSQDFVKIGCWLDEF